MLKIAIRQVASKIKEPGHKKFSEDTEISKGMFLRLKKLSVLLRPRRPISPGLLLHLQQAANR